MLGTAFLGAILLEEEMSVIGGHHWFPAFDLMLDVVGDVWASAATEEQVSGLWERGQGLPKA